MRLDCLPAAGRTYGQTRVIRQNGIDPDQDGIGSRPELHSKGSGLRAGDPFGFTRGSGDFAVECHRGFDRDERPPANNPIVKSFVEAFAGGFQNPVSNLNAGSTKQTIGLARMSRVWIGSADNNVSNPSVD